MMESFRVGSFFKLVKDPFIQKGTKQQQQKTHIYFKTSL